MAVKHTRFIVDDLNILVFGLTIMMQTTHGSSTMTLIYFTFHLAKHTAVSVYTLQLIATLLNFCISLAARLKAIIMKHIMSVSDYVRHFRTRVSYYHAKGTCIVRDGIKTIL